VRLGLFGGTFDPIHIGHLVGAQVAMEEARLDQVLFMPAGVNPLKAGKRITPGTHRLEMVRLAIEDHPQFALSDWELRQGGLSFTANTLEHLHAEHPQAELFLLMGADNVQLLPRWRHVDRILELATILALTRPGFDLAVHGERLRAQHPELADRMQYVAMPGLEVSSTWIRERLARNRTVAHLLPPSVIRYSEGNKLYE